MFPGLSDHVDTIAALYAPPPGYFSTVQQTGGICWAIRRVNNEDRVVCRGSDDPLDWWRDLKSETSRVVGGYPSIGHVPLGFGAGLLAAYVAIRRTLRAGAAVYFEGHSLGAAHAAELAGMYIADGYSPAGIVLCGCPKPGMIPLTTLLGSKEMPFISLRNGEDPVPDVPAPLPPLLEWRDAGPITAISVPPGPSDTESGFAKLVPDAAWHSIKLYQQGAKTL